MSNVVPFTTGLYGGDGWGTSTDFDSELCANGAYITSIKGVNGQFINQVCAECSDGKNLGCFSGLNLTDSTSKYGLMQLNGFDNVPIRYGSWIDNILGFGGSGGKPYTLTCPTGTYATGIYGKKSQYIDKLGLKCGYKYSTPTPTVVNSTPTPTVVNSTPTPTVVN
ncbi:hypothetical protein EB001_14600, partial [bacterium]|nr:hypothetical protein [bacterium]